MSKPKLSINCLLLGSDSSEVFTVKIPKTDNVSVLKDRIKEKQSPRLNHVDASELTVWKVSLPADTISPELTVDGVKALHSVEKISLIFDEALEDKHVHILVQAPTATRLQLNCYVKGEPFKQAFEVKIGNDESVAALKGAIKAERAQTFSNVDAASIVLWNISIPYNPTLADNVDKLHLDDDGLPQVSDQYIQSLSPLRKLSDIFSKPPIEEHVHIIIKPPPARSTINEANLREKDDIVTALKTSSFLPITTI
ncbi:hypothetical protein F5887DRAFT_903271 [Amanita rubescens]|nr:hypothetical protein F5887DRAFT_903271 [Amanita rubescens]